MADRVVAANRLSRIVLIVDACFLLFMGISSTVFDLMSNADGSGPMGSIMLGSPLVVGFVEAHLLIAAVGIGSLVAATRAARAAVWHTFAVVVHLVLAWVDLYYHDIFGALQIGGTGFVSYALPTVHGLFVVAHLAGIARARSVAAVARQHEVQHGARDVAGRQAAQ